MIIAIDGPAGAGKGTLARAIAEKYQLAYLDTGLIYRAVAHKVLENQAPFEDERAAVSAAESLTLADLKDVELLRSETMGNAASLVGKNPRVRKVLYSFQRHFALNPPVEKKGAILDGRDIGTAVCPDAHLKFYITANVEVRAKRRLKELQERRIKSIYSVVLQEIMERDLRDSRRRAAPMTQATDAIFIDSSDKTPAEMIDIASSYIDQFLDSQK
jgi:cytidylate kinase